MVLNANSQLIGKSNCWFSAIKCSLLFIVSLLLLGSPKVAISQSRINISLEARQLGFVRTLYEQKEYHRSISEILRIKFQYPATSEMRKLDLYLLKIYYRLKEYKSVETVASAMLSEKELLTDMQTTRKTGLILMTSLLEQGYEKRAQHTWETYVKSSTAGVFPASETYPDLIDPNRASFYSGILPGSGFLFSESYGKAVVSFMLNLLFISGSHQAFTQQQYGISGLFLFFEINWYFGGKKASAEAARRFNRKRISHFQRNWIRTQLDNNNLSDLSSKTGE